MADKCQEFVDAITKTDTAQRTMKATKGEAKINKIMDPLREKRALIKEMPETTKIQRDTKLAAEENVGRHYSQAGETKPSTPERNEITTRLKEDPEVAEYLRSLDYNAYADLRAEIQGTFGGEQARVAEIKFREVKIDDMTPRLQQQGIYTQTIQDALGTIKGEGAINQRNFEMMRGLDDLSKNGIDTIKTGTARQTYDRMVAQMQKTITNDIFATVIDKNFDKLILDINDSNITAKLFRKLPTNDELKMFDDIKTGKRTPDGSTYEASMRMLDKINADGWTTIRGVIKPLDELNAADKRAIARELVNRWSVKKIATSPKTIAATTVTVLIGFPAYVTVTGMWQQGQFENNMQFGKWVDDKTSNGLWNRFLSDDAKTAQELAKKAQSAWLDMYNYMVSIPIIGEWYKFVVDTVGTYAMVKGFDNDAKLNIFGPLVDKGMAVEDPSTPWGFRRLEPDEMKAIYENNPSKLFLNDNAWQDEHNPWTVKTGIFTKTGKELTPAQAMKLYYAEKGKFGAGGSYDELEDESTMKAVREYGKRNDKAGQTTQTTTYQKTTIPTMNEFINQGLQCEGKTCTEEVYNRLLNLGWTIYEDPITGKPKWAQTQREIPMDAKGNPAKILNQALPGTVSTTPNKGGGGGSDEEETGRQSQLEKQLTNKEITLNKENIMVFKKEGKVDITKAKAAGQTVTDLAAVDRPATVAGYKDRMRDMVTEKKIDKNEYDRMKQEDPKAAKEALKSAIGCET